MVHLDIHMENEEYFPCKNKFKMYLDLDLRKNTPIFEDKEIIFMTVRWADIP